MSSLTPEQMAVVQPKLASGHKFITQALETGLVEEWIRSGRLLVLIENSGENAILVFSCLGDSWTSPSDLKFERVIPVDSDFKCEIDASNGTVTSTDIYMKITRGKTKLLFELLPGFKANRFVDEVVKATENIGRRKTPLSNFDWVAIYQQPETTASDKDSATQIDGELSQKFEKILSRPTDLDGLKQNARPNLIFYSTASPDLSSNRPATATGAATPVAARESVVRYQMALREEAYTDLQTIRVFLGTYNVNGQPPTQSLADWLASDAEPPDVYALGFQELDLSKEAFLFNETPREEEWLRAVLRALHPKAKYHKVRLVRLVGMMLIVFVQEKHRAYIRAISAETVGTGLMGKMGNKGGVAIRFDLRNSSLCFVNCHLAAHVEEVERRNQDYMDICNRLVFSSFIPAKSIKDHDVVYWLGDLNYRLTGDLDSVKVKELLEQQNYAALLEYDQFKHQYAARKIFHGFQEGPVNFKPSYKYDPGTDNWDSSEKNRAPAWCDRVLWKGDYVKLLDYRSHPTIRLSDHKPVSALTDCSVKVIDNVRYRKVYEGVMKKLDKLENDYLPQVSVDTTEFQFGTVKFQETYTQTLTIANTGQVPVQFEFIKKNRDTTFCKPWLTVSPFSGFLLPGENVYVSLRIFVDKTTAWTLNGGVDSLYDILVLHLDGGKDIFITVNGQYQYSCFGCSLEALVHMHQPVRQVPKETLHSLEKSAYVTSDLKSDPDSDSTQPVLAVPKELWFLLDELYRRGMDVAGLFEQPGSESEFVAIRDSLDTSLPDTLPGSIHSVAEGLLIFLEALREPIIPFALTQRALESSSTFQGCKAVVAALPLSHQHVFRHIVSFLKEVMLHSSKNGLDVKTLAALFSSAFIRLPHAKGSSATSAATTATTSQQHLDRKRSLFVYHFLANDWEN